MVICRNINYLQLSSKFTKHDRFLQLVICFNIFSNNSLLYQYYSYQPNQDQLRLTQILPHNSIFFHMNQAQPHTERALRHHTIVLQAQENVRPHTTHTLPINKQASDHTEICSSILRKSSSMDEQFIKNQQHFIPATISSTSFTQTNKNIPQQLDFANKKYKDEDTISTHCKVQSGQINSSKVIQNAASFRKIRQLSPFKQQSKRINNNQHDISKEQLYKTFEYTCQFQQIKRMFKQQLKKIMAILKEDDQMILMKNRHTFSYKCIVTLCLPAMEDEVVYELKKCEHASNRAKLQLLSGDPIQFQILKKTFLAKLWQQKKINTNQIEGLQYFFFLNSKTFQLIQQEIHMILTRRFINQKRNSLVLLPYCQAKNTEQRTLIKILQYTKSILYVIKYSTENFKKKVAESQQFDFSPMLEKKIQSLIFDLVKISKMYYVIYEQENTKIRCKKNNIKKQFSLIEIFQFLEVKKQHRLLNDDDTFKNCSLDQLNCYSVLPFSEAIKALDSLNIEDPPSVLLAKIQLFTHNIKSSFNRYSISIKVLELDMDSLLPLIIYCVLISSNDSLISTSKMMLDYLQFEDSWQAQKKMFTTIEASFNYIRIQWKVQSGNIITDKQLRQI